MPDTHGAYAPRPSHRDASLSVVIPVYNSEGLVSETVDRTVEYLEGEGFDFEIILVNDGSTDGSWKIISEKAGDDPRIIAVDLLQNYGQHTAVFAGLQRSRNDYAITMDDDQQNPPEEIGKLVAKANEGYDLVMGEFEQKRHSWYRRMGSKVIGWMNRRVFHKPKDLVLTNFRCIRHDVVLRMGAYRTAYPYIPGLALMFSSDRANVTVEHHPRPEGKSNYSFGRILAVVLRILFNYSSFPLRFVSGLGLIITGFSFLLAVVFFFRGILGDTTVPGWASVIVLLSFFNGVSLLILSMLGEYTVRLLNQSSQSEPYHIKATVGRDG